MTAHDDADGLDARLLVRAAAGDAAAARLLAARLAPRAIALATRMLGDRTEAEDVAQEALLRLWRVAPAWREGEAPVGAWVRRVAANLCLDRLRRRGRWGALDEAAEPEDPAPGPLDRLAAADRATALAEAIARLPDRQRAAVTLRHFEEMGNPEIAAALGVSVEAVESLLARARRRLADALAAHRAGAA